VAIFTALRLEKRGLSEFGALLDMVFSCEDI
jgi:hypothetical protein